VSHVDAAGRQRHVAPRLWCTAFPAAQLGSVRSDPSTA